MGLHKVNSIDALGTLLLRREDWAHVKVKAEGLMHNRNVKDTCKRLGYEASCFCNNDCSNSDDTCVKTMRESHTLPEISTAICPENENPRNWWECSLMNEVCEYMPRYYNSGWAVCAIDNERRNGKSYSNKWAACALRL